MREETGLLGQRRGNHKRCEKQLDLEQVRIHANVCLHVGQTDDVLMLDAAYNGLQRFRMELAAIGCILQRQRCTSGPLESGTHQDMLGAYLDDEAHTSDQQVGSSCRNSSRNPV